MRTRQGAAVTSEVLCRLVLLGVFILDVFWLAVPEATAHPHVFIVQRMNMVFDDQGLAGIKLRWKFDDMFASMIAEDFDRNRDGRLESSEVRTVKEKAFSYLAEFNYFVFVKIDSKPFQVQYITDFNAILKDHQLEYQFFVPCHVRATRHVKEITVSTYDPSYYSAIFFAENRPVSLTSADAYEVKTAIREDPSTTIYYDMIHPWTLFLKFKLKP